MCSVEIEVKKWRKTEKLNKKNPIILKVQKWKPSEP